MELTALQYEKLADLCMDIAKALFIAAFVTPAVVREATVFYSLQSFSSGAVLVYFSLILVHRKEGL